MAQVEVDATNRNALSEVSCELWAASSAAPGGAGKLSRSSTVKIQRRQILKARALPEKDIVSLVSANFGSTDSFETLLDEKSLAIQAALSYPFLKSIHSVRVRKNCVLFEKRMSRLQSWSNSLDERVGEKEHQGDHEAINGQGLHEC